MSVPLFVYGTLTAEGGQGALLGPCLRRPAVARGTLWRMPEGYPALALAGEGVVWGERVDGVPASALAALDAYEGVDVGLYRRVRVDVLCEGERALVWAWVMDEPALRGGVLIPSGRFAP